MYSRFSKKLVNIFTIVGWLIQSLTISFPAAAQTSIKQTVLSYPCNGVIFDFASDTQGWTAKDYSQRYAEIAIAEADLNESPAGKNSLSLDLNLNRSHQSAEFIVDLYKTPPACAKDLSREIPWWEPGSILSVWVWAPSGTRGNTTNPNGLHLFAIDDEGNEIYGTWQNIQENTWFEVILMMEGEAPVCGNMDSGFDFSHIRNLGLNISINSNAQNASIKDIIRISPISVKSSSLIPPISSHLYSFDEALISSSPKWKNLKDEWNAKAITSIALQDGALVASTNFLATVPYADHKAVIGIIFAPALNLSDLAPAQDVFSLDIKFDTPPDLKKSNCPFVIKLWAYDKAQSITFASDDQNVGSNDWTRVAFRLTDFKILNTDDVKKIGNKSIDLSQIGQIGFQIYGNIEYHGRIWVDNIALGSEVSVQKLPALPFVKTDGPHFTLENQRFRFIGANAEYLPMVPDSVVDDVLDRAQSMGIRVIRTWGFGDGCEDYHQPSCTDWSRYFQPAPGVYNTSAFEHFDRIVYEAGKRNIRLIIPLANNWGEYGGIPRYICWFESIDSDCPGNFMPDEIHDTFYTNEKIKEWYRQYVYYFVNHENTLTGIRYADDPTIMAWELINEPRARSDPSGAILHSWIVEMSGYLAGLVPNQLIGTGEEGWYIMPKAEADRFKHWQGFEKNYWHYGVNWIDDSCEESWGSNGADFLSDNSSTSRIVTWQEKVNNGISFPRRTSERQAVLEVDFTGIHVYPAPGETSLAMAPYCYYYGLDALCASSQDTSNKPEPGDEIHQTREWIAQHVETAHHELNKPFILEEFNFPVPAKSSLSTQTNSIEESFQVTPKERARLFNQYLDFAYDLDVDGIMFWNLGYDGFANQAWGELDELRKWVPEVEGTVSRDDPKGIMLNYRTDLGFHKTAMTLSNPQVDWLHADGSQVLVDLYNEGDAQTVFFEVQLSDGSVPKSQSFPIKSGENSISLTSLFESKSQDEPEKQDFPENSCPKPKKEPPAITKIDVAIQDYELPGSAFFNFHTIFNNKYVIYPGDPVEDVIQLASAQWQQDIARKQSSVKIDHTITCNTRIHPKIVNEKLPIQFDFVGSIEHPDGYYYRYLINGPKDKNESNFGSIGLNQSDQIAIDASVIGKYQVSIAPEGVSFDDPGADSCYFEIGNSAPVLTIDKLRIGDQDYQPPYDVVEVSSAFIQMNRQIEIRVSGTDDVSENLKMSYRLLKGNKEIDNDVFSGPSIVTAITQLGATGLPITIKGALPPGHYQLQLWLMDQESEVSGIKVLNLTVPLPLYIYGFFAIGLILLLGSYAKLGKRVP